MRVDGWAWCAKDDEVRISVPSAPISVPLRPLVAVVLRDPRPDALFWNFATGGDGWATCASAQASVRRTLDALRAKYPDCSVEVGVPSLPDGRPEVLLGLAWRAHPHELRRLSAVPVPDGIEPITLARPEGPGTPVVGTLQIRLEDHRGSPLDGVRFRLEAQYEPPSPASSYAFLRPTGTEIELPSGTWHLKPQEIGLPEVVEGPHRVLVEPGRTTVAEFRIADPRTPCRLALSAALRDLSGALFVVIRDDGGQAAAKYTSLAQAERQPIVWLATGRHSVQLSFAPVYRRVVDARIDVPRRGSGPAIPAILPVEDGSHPR